jgi:hypothetical protein
MRVKRAAERGTDIASFFRLLFSPPRHCPSHEAIATIANFEFATSAFPGFCFGGSEHVASLQFHYCKVVPCAALHDHGDGNFTYGTLQRCQHQQQRPV